MDNKSLNNPMDNDDIHQTVNNEQPFVSEERTPFNDVIKHGDIINNSQTPKRIEQIPKSLRRPFKIFTIIFLLIFISALIYQAIQMFH